MSLDKKKRREIVFQILFSKDISPLEKEEMIPFFMKQLKVARSYVKEAICYVETLFSYVEKIDSLIQEHSLEYPLHRIYLVEKNILRLAIFEMLYDPSVSVKQAVIEAIRLSKKFSSQESIKFVNAVLDAIWKRHSPSCSKSEATKA